MIALYSARGRLQMCFFNPLVFFTLKHKFHFILIAVLHTADVKLQLGFLGIFLGFVYTLKRGL